jgi:replicative DNA helicase
MKWKDDSELVAGLVLEGRLAPEAVDHNILFPPYSQMVQAVGDGKERSDMVENISLASIIASESVAELLPVGEEMTALEQLERSSIRAEIGGVLRPLAKTLEKGEDVDISDAVEALSRLANGHHEFVTADMIEPQKMIYIPSYYPPLDREIGGYPYAGLTIVAGITGSGKSTFLMELAISAAKKQKECAIITLEMTNSQFLYRTLQIDPKLSTAAKKRIHMSDQVYSVEGVYAAATRMVSQHPNLQFIGVDYADMLVAQKEQSEAVMGKIYHTLSVLAKKTRVPVILIAQYRRTDGSIPTIEDIRYSGRAEQAASMVLLLHNPDVVWSRTRMANKNPLEYYEGVAYIVVGKLRYAGKNGRSVGAIPVNWDEDNGSWGRTIVGDGWFDLKGQV